MEGYLRKRSVRFALLIGVVLISLWGIYLLRDVFAPLILAFLLAYVLDPLADALERVRVGRIRINRFTAVVTIFVATALVVGTVFVTGVYYVKRGVNQLYRDSVGELVYSDPVEAESAAEGRPVLPTGTGYYIDANRNGARDPGYLERIKEYAQRLGEEYAVAKTVREFIDDVTAEGAKLNPRQLRDIAEEWITTLRSMTGAGGQQEAQGGGLSLFAFISYLLFCPLYTFFFLLEIDPMIAAMQRYLPGRHRGRIEQIFGKIDKTLSSFLRGRLIICLVKSAIAAIGLALLGVKYAIPLGLGAGFLSLIPYIGIYFSMIPALILCWLEYSSWGRIMGVLVVYGVNEGLEGIVLVPQILGKEIGLHPLTVIVTLLVFAKIFGFLGLLLSVPLAAITKILAQEVILPLVEEFAEEKPESSPDPPS